MTPLVTAVPSRSAHAEDNGFGPRVGVVPFPEGADSAGVVDQFVRIATRHASRPAVVDGAVHRSYAQVHGGARSYSRAIREWLGTREGAVGLQLALGWPAIEAILGVLCAGRPYCFLPEAPESTIRDIVREVPLAGVVAANTAGAAARFGRVPVVSPEHLRDLGSGQRDDATGDASATACLFATSGTTGAPKIVSIPHRVIVSDIARQVRDLFLGPDDRIDLLFHPAFSASLSSIFSALLTGAALHLRAPDAEAATLGAWLAESGITISTMTVSSFRSLAATLDPAIRLSSLRLLSIGGEPVRAADVREFLRVFPSTCVLQNAMASTETRTYAQYFVTRSVVPDDPVPIGWPVDGKSVTIVDADGLPVPVGEAGEIVVRSRDLADGYANDGALTAGRFHRHADGSVSFHTGDRGRIRADGCLLFLGRADTLVKVRGQRVDMAAVEHELRADPRVAEAAVVSHVIAGEPVLVGFVEARPGLTLDADDLRHAVARRLAAAAVPRDVRVLSAVPLNRNGKTDYADLRRRLASVPVPDPHGDLLDVVRTCWACALDRTAVAGDTDFFTAGGDSLNAARLQLALFERTGREVPYAALVAHPTPRRLTEWLVHTAGAVAHPALICLANGGRRPPLFCVPGIGGEPLSFKDFADRLGGARPIYGLGAIVGIENRRGALTIEQIAATYVEAVDSVVGPGDPILLCGHSFGAVVAHEMTRQFERRGRRVALLAVIDTPLAREGGGVMARARDVSRNLPGWIRYDLLESDGEALLARALGKASDWQRQALATLGLQARPAYPDFRAYFGGRAVPAEVVERMHVRLDALRRYGYPPIDTRVVLFRCRGQALGGRSDRTLGWHRMAAGVDVYDVPGHHDSCTQPPHVDALVHVLAGVLERQGL